MTRLHSSVYLFLAITTFAVLPAFCGPVVIDFEGLSDGTFVTTQYPNLTFSNAIIATAGISLNELEFPPESGVNVILDNGGPISVDFVSAVSSFGGFFTYLEPVTIQGFDSSNDVLASSTSLFSNNLACLDGPPCQGDPGSSPDEFIQVNSPAGFSSVTITGDPGGYSFALDDVTYSLASTSSVPEPSSRLLLAGLLFACVIRRLTRPSAVLSGRSFFVKG
jgi:hypothetical protein